MWEQKQVDEHDHTSQKYLSIKGRECEVTIETRPCCCDRGNWIAKVHPINYRMNLELDWQDGWPRYYFDLDRAKLECEAWLKKRKQWID